MDVMHRIAELFVGLLRRIRPTHLQIFVDRLGHDADMQLLRRLWLAKREESQAFLAAIAQPFLDRQAIALRLRNLLALLVEEHLIDQSLGLAPAERLGDLARLEDRKRTRLNSSH